MKPVYLVRSIIECSTCAGQGVIHFPKEESTCPACAGAGYQEHDEIPLEEALAELNQTAVVSQNIHYTLKALEVAALALMVQAVNTLEKKQ